MSDAVHRWSADREGKLPEDDKLGRLEFAQRVARELGAWRNKESLVISLNGDWGSGKSTLVNLVLHYVGEQSKAGGQAAPAVVHFNPWQWSGQDMLFEAFFGEIGDTLGREQPGSNGVELAKKWKRFGALSGAGRATAQWAETGAVAVAAASLAAGHPTVAAGATAGAGVSAWIKGMFSAGEEVSQAAAGAHEAELVQSLAEVRADLKGLLTDMPAPLIVVIDDLDRLTKEQVRMVVQLVKANADFDNVVYVLPFQRDIIAKALDHVTSEKGQDFLKKIVQVELEVPDAPPDKLRAIFFEQMDKIWRRAEFRWDEERKDRWRNMFEDAIWPFFDTPRSVNRFCSVMDFVFDGHIDDRALRVDPIDLVTLETLRMFEPEAYALIKRSRNTSRNVFLELLYDDKERREKIEADFNALIERPDRPAMEKKRLRSALYGLIPQAGEKSESDRSKAEWDRDSRVCHPKHFPKYFQLQDSPEDVPAGLVAKFLRQSTPEARLRELWNDAVRTNKASGLIERLWLVRDEIPVERVVPMILAILGTTDSLPAIKIEGGLFQSDAEREISKLCARLLTRISEQNQRDNAFINVVRNCDALSGPVMLTGFLEPDPERPRYEEPVVSPGAVEQAKQELIPRIWAKAKTPEFWELRMAGYILYRLKDWAPIEDVRAWLDSATRDFAVARKCLFHFLTETQSTGRITRTQVLPAKSIEEFIPLDVFLARLDGPGLSSLELHATQRLKLALDRKASGKAYDRIPVIGFDREGEEITDIKELNRDL